MNTEEIRAFSEAIAERNRAERELSSARELIEKISTSATGYLDRDGDMAQWAKDWLNNHKPLDTPSA